MLQAEAFFDCVLGTAFKSALKQAMAQPLMLASR
jgi:hypothetical protein